MPFIQASPDCWYLMLILMAWGATVWVSHNAAIKAKDPWQPIRGALIISALFLVTVLLTDPFLSAEQMRALSLGGIMLFLTKLFFIMEPVMIALGLTFGAIKKLRTLPESV